MKTDKTRRTQRKIARLEIVSQMWLRGYTYRNIRQVVMTQLDLKSYSLETVKSDIDTLKEELKERRINNGQESLNCELAKIDDILKEAWEAWERSKNPVNTKIHKVKGKKQDTGQQTADNVEMTKREDDSCGDPRYLDIINKQLQERRRLLGLYAPESQEIYHKGSMALELSREQIEKELERLRVIT